MKYAVTVKSYVMYEIEVEAEIDSFGSAADLARDSDVASGITEAIADTASARINGGAIVDSDFEVVSVSRIGS